MDNGWQTMAQQALQKLWGEKVTCTITDELRTEGRNRVYRMTVTDAPVSSLIFKASLGDENNPYVVGNDTPWSAFSRFCNEWAGCEMLSPLGLGPIAYTGNIEDGFYLMEDLGQGESLADRLTGRDPKATTAALFAYARSLGELHAATQHQDARWLELRQKLGGTAALRAISDSWQKDVSAFSALCERHEVGLPTGFDLEMARIGNILEQPGKYLVFSPTDCCPDNHYLRGERVIFFDCEGATTRHALLDVAYLLAPFPTCWCTSRLPAGLAEHLIAAYQEYFPGGADFDEQLTLALASWTISTLTWDWAGNWEEQDHTWGLVTLRQRHLHRLENLLARENLKGLLPSLNEVTQGLHGVLKSRWTDLEPMPLYTAFQR
jgi:hypothetical protein